MSSKHQLTGSQNCGYRAWPRGRCAPHKAQQRSQLGRVPVHECAEKEWSLWLSKESLTKLLPVTSWPSYHVEAGMLCSQRTACCRRKQASFCSVVCAAMSCSQRAKAMPSGASNPKSDHNYNLTRIKLNQQLFDCPKYQSFLYIR